MTTSASRFMERALILAQQAAEQGEVPVGAVVVYQNNIIGEGYNQPITACDPTAHAEIVAMRQAAQYLENYRLIDCDLYVSLEPCAMCAGAMIHARIKNLFFGAFDPKSSADAVFSSSLSEKLNHKVNIEGGLLETECAHLLKEFFKAKR